MITIYTCENIGKKILWGKNETEEASIEFKQKTFQKRGVNLYIDFQQQNDETLTIKIKYKEKSIPNDKEYYKLKQIGDTIVTNEYKFIESTRGILPIGTTVNLDYISVECIMSGTTSILEIYSAPVTEYV